MEIRILDGGIGTECERIGLAIKDDPLWSARMLITNQDDIKQIHKGFLVAGSDIVETNTYQTSVVGFMEHANLSEEKAYNLMQRAAEIATEAVEEFWSQQAHIESDRLKPVVAGSIGPYGACQHDSSEYHGNYVETMTIEELKNWHRSRFQALTDAGITLFAIETIPATKEGEAILELLLEFPDIKAWLTFSCKDGTSTCHGESFKEAVAMASASPSIVAVGVNCCPPSLISPLLQSAQGVTNGKPFVIFPNSGEKWTGSGWSAQPEAKNWQAHILEWIHLGARYIGGCCQIGPEDIRLIRNCVKTVKASR